jgi:ankyrin repeat protein
MRKIVVFLYFVFIFKLAFANSLPSINVFNSNESSKTELAKIEPASGVQLAENKIPELPTEKDSASAPLPDDFDLPTLDSKEEESDDQKNTVANNPQTDEKTEEFDSAPLPPTLGTGAVAPAVPAEVSDIPTLPQQPTTNNVAPAVAPEQTNNDANGDNINIDQIISESSVREQFPETPELNKNTAKKRDEESKVVPVNPQERAEEVDSLLNEVFDKNKTPEELAKEKEDVKKDKKLEKELAENEQLDIPLMEDVVSVDDQSIQPLDSLAEGSVDGEQLPLESMPDSMRDNYQPKISSKGKTISSSNTYSEQKLSELLVMASMRGDKKSVIDLINSGRSPNSQNQFGETALMGAVYSGNNEIIEILLSEGADANLADNKGNTALIVASARNNVQAVQQLIKAGADIDIANNASDTPILVAALNNNNQVLDTLVRDGGDVNKANAEGLTALHIGAYNDNATLVRYLLNLGANPNVLAKGGYKPYDLLRDKNGQSAQLLITYATDMQRKLEAQKAAYEIKARNSAPVAKNIYASSDQYSLIPKAYSENEQPKPASASLPKSDWWAAKNAEQPIKADYAKPVIEQAQQTAEPIQDLQIEDLGNQNISEVSQKPASLAFKERRFSNNSAQQALPQQNFTQQATTETTNKMQKSVPVDNVEVETLNVQTQTATTQTAPAKQWRKLTVDQASLAKEQQMQKAPQVNNNLPIINQVKPVRAVYDDNGNVISQNVIAQPAPIASVAPIAAPLSQPASLAVSKLNQQKVVSPAPTNYVQSQNQNQMQIQTIQQNTQTVASTNQAPSYGQLDKSKQQVWDFRLQQWVKDGYFFDSFNEVQKASWLGQQKVFQYVYQEQFNSKVETIKKQLTGSAAVNTAKPAANNNYAQQNIPQQDAFLSSYAVGNAPLSQTF